MGMDGPRTIDVGTPDVVVIEGINVLQAHGPRLVSDQLDLSIYVDAEEEVVRGWFTDRLVRLRHLPPGEAPSFFASFDGASDEEFLAIADSVWSGVNRPNLELHIAPTRARAHVVVHKGPDHVVDRCAERQPDVAVAVGAFHSQSHAVAVYAERADIAASKPSREPGSQPRDHIAVRGVEVTNPA